MVKFYIACLCCLTGLASAVIVVDDFSTAQSLPELTTQTVTGPGILGQERYTRTYSRTAAQINTTYPNQAYFTGLLGGVMLRYDGTDNTNGLNMDLTEGGQNTGFQVSITNVGPVETYVRLYVIDNNFQGAWLGFWVSEPQALFLPFEDFSEIMEADLGTDSLSLQMTSAPVDFTNVNYLYVSIYTYDGQSSITLSSFAVVPEPASLCLLGAGGLVLLRKRK